MANPAKVYLIDASVYIFRAWFSLPDTMVNARGESINALHGFAGFLADLKARAGAEAVIAVAFDESLESSFRNRIYAEYKANRPPAPLELKRQFAWCRAVCQALGLPQHADHEFEADDIIGTWAAQAREQGKTVAVVSRDKDLTQLIGPGDIWWDFASDKRLGPEGVREKMGVPPEQVADLLALTGDSVDNIPGVAGVGPKAAVALLDAFGSLESVLENLDQVPSLSVRGAKSLAEKLRQGAEQARLSQALTRIPLDCPRVPPLPSSPTVVEGAALQANVQALGLGPGLQRRLRVYAAD